MSFNLNSSKPSLSSTDPLCNFRTSKAYLWGLIRDYLSQEELNNNRKLNILDAACHALITRNMFPSGCNYYGLDISYARLSDAISRKKPGDILFMADITRDLRLRSCFDIVVSLNTMSHLSEDSQDQAIDNLLSTLNVNGSLYLNTSVAHSYPTAAKLRTHFESIIPVYFDSYLSDQMETASLIDSKNVMQFVTRNEVNIPNDAIFHRQVVFKCKGFSSSISSQPTDIISLFHSNKKLPSIIKLNSIPSLNSIAIDTDFSIPEMRLNPESSVFILSPKLHDSAYGNKLISFLSSLGFRSSRLSSNFKSSAPSDRLYILGLENEWSYDLRLDRIALNVVRSLPIDSLTILSVASRDKSSCTRSVVSFDY